MSGSRILQGWARQQAEDMVSRVEVLPTANKRVIAIVGALNSLQSGLANFAQQRLVIYRRHGYPYDVALRMGVADALAKFGAKQANAADKGYGTRLMSGAMFTGGLSGMSAEQTNDLLDSIGGLVSRVTSAAVGVAETVTTVRDRRRQAEFEREQWRTQFAAETAQAEREFEAQMARREEDAERRAEELAASEQRRRRERQARQQAGGGLGLGGILIALGVTTAVAGGGYYIYKQRSERS